MGYLKCKSCGGYYKLQDEESPDYFKSCTCGGELEFYDDSDPKRKRKKIHSLLMIIIIIVGGYFIFSFLGGAVMVFLLDALIFVGPSYGTYIFILFFGALIAIIIGLLWVIFRKK